jgi:hypothetical protein
MTRVVFVRWTNGVPQVQPGGSAYFKVGNNSIVQDCYISCEPTTNGPSVGIANYFKWNVNLLNHGTASIWLPSHPPYRQAEPPAQMTVHSGHQGILRLVDEVRPEGQSGQGRSGFELRVFVEPGKYSPIRTNPFEFEGTNFVAGYGSGWTPDEALKAIKEWPVDQ